MKPDSSVVDKTIGAGRPRDRRIDESILRATAELLVSMGYSNLTMSAVAERAGTTKTALYRRWSNKAELVHETVFPATPGSGLNPPHADIADDVRGMIRAACDVFSMPVLRAALPGLVADVAADTELNARVNKRFEGLFAAVRARLEEAIARGEVRGYADADRLIEIIGGTTMMRLLLHPDQELDDAWVDQMTNIVVHGVVK
ncbi:MAG TPA: TetR/AcrR family transcriptional regulator [Mycobacterium sp.]|nr:TetR/AcrR family transcriptional regulator [Mycobacterium sp.]